MRFRHPHYCTFLAVAASSVAFALALLPAASAGAQDALGSGNALDANLSTRTRSNAPANRMDFRARNLLITNDVAGGRGFRGSVGYEAAGDFSARLGSNDLFSFRAGSAYSDPSLIRYGNAYTQLRLGAAGGPLEYRRSGYAPGVYEIPPGTARIVERTEAASARTMLDRISSERLTTNQALTATPQPVGVVYDAEGRANVVESSPLRGLFLTPMDDVADGGDSLLGRAADRGARDGDDRADRRQEVIAPFESLQIDARGEDADRQASARLDQQDQAGRIETATGMGRDEYAQILERVVERYASAQNVNVRLDPAMLRQLGVEYDQLRNRLASAGQPGEGDAAADRLRGDPFDLDDPRAMNQPDRPGGADDPADLTRPQAGEDETPEEFEIVLKHDEVVETLVGAQKDRFNELLAQGEQRLRVGEYFLAERSFERALRMVRGHPMAGAGYGHAQLGAGMYRSANYTLRNLLTAHPAMIDVRYQTGLIPNRVRLLNTVAVLDERLREEDFDRDLNGFLMAYIGHQIEDRDLVGRGLDAMQQAAPDDPLIPVLRTVWLAEDDADEDAGGDDGADDGAGDEPADDDVDDAGDGADDVVDDALPGDGDSGGSDDG